MHNVDLKAFCEGKSFDAYLDLGAHPAGDGYRFAVWAPNAYAVSLVGDFNHWDPNADPMTNQGYGIWRIEKAGIGEFAAYKYAIRSGDGLVFKADPYAFHAETRPGTASKTFRLNSYTWNDGDWMAKRASYDPYHSPISIYEMHLASWKLDEQERLYTYERMADEIVPYLKDMGYTHVQLLPVMEHPLDISWGYQVTGFFAPTSRFGDPNGLRLLIDRLHQAGIGVLLDWVPAHFPKDEFGLRRFDGTCLYESADPTRGENPSWGTCMFDVGRPEVASFLLSSAVYWLKEFHADGLRVDAVSYMLYLDYGREPNDWHPNTYGGNENLESLAFLRRLNEVVYAQAPGIIMAAEEATAFPSVTKPVYMGGLGFGFKWNMGWMHDMLDYMELDPIYRKYHHDKLTFSLVYAFSENYILPFSHDEVAHGKHSMLDKMPGDIWKKFAGLRAVFGYMFAHPGKKLMFMGAEFGQFIEWRETAQLDWFLLLYQQHPDMQKYVKALNAFYTATPALYEVEDSWAGFSWCDANDSQHSILSFVRYDQNGGAVMAVLNFTPEYWDGYRIGIPNGGALYQVLNSDEEIYGGSGKGNGNKAIRSEPIPWSGQKYSAVFVVPPLSCVYYRYEKYKGFHPRKRVEHREQISASR